MSRRVPPERLPGIVDSHAHLQHAAFDADRDAVIERAREAGIAAVLVPGWDLASSEAALELADRHPDLLAAAVGIHPHHADQLDDAAAQRLEALASEPRCAAVGEIGLDHYRRLTPVDVQREALDRQLHIASVVGKPVVVHDREAHVEVADALRAWHGVRGRAVRGVLHCFSGDAAMATEAAASGYLVSFALSVTFGRWRTAREAAAVVPQESLLVETDSPYLGAGPDRRNEPTTVLRVAVELAKYRGTTPDVVASAAGRAYRRLLDG